MGNCVDVAAGRRSSAISLAISSSPYRLRPIWTRKNKRQRAFRSSDLREPPHRLCETAGDRREFALRASVDDLLKAAALRASESLKTTRPDLSAGTLSLCARTLPTLFGLAAILAMLNNCTSSVLCLLVVLPNAFRLLHVAVHGIPAVSVSSPPVGADDELPVYSIILPLRREAKIVDQLLSAIERLDYPTEKLDVIIAVEADEPETRMAIDRRKHRIPLTVIPVPPIGPRTKPKALNVALEFARGALTVIYDAEDRPESQQLRRAVEAFRTAGSDLACVQAPLCIDTKTTWLTRFFTAEYAGQFDILLPILAARRLPLPLGGSSNHFRTDILRDVGGWDAYNVTEDADLGMRLARRGYRCDVIGSTTYEEAPARVHSWLNQRSRWLKGWMQTWLVHMRTPGRLARQLGLGGFLTFQFIVGGNALVALAHPVFLLRLLYGGLAPLFGLPDQYVVFPARQAEILASAAIGYLVSAVPGFLGLRRRGLARKSWVLFCTPLHWVLLSIAGWRGARQLISAPFHWSKTEHGLCDEPHPDGLIGALLTLNAHITDLARRGEIPQIWIGATGSGANRRLHPPAAA
ncbi:MAG TPA: glycosyltransferase family 2 protein [Pseudolabrys sp.]|nr:glycosyltransferase family 2 protein [Pseudolabrys sp.]